MKFIQIQILIVIVLFTYIYNITQKILYNLPEGDRISGIHQLSNGWILAGIGQRYKWPPEKEKEAAFLISKDNGENWKEIKVEGLTDLETYQITSNNNIVIAVRGDRNEPQILRSENYGENWNIILNTGDLYKLTGSNGPLYSVIYDKNDKKFYAFPNAKVIESSDNGLTWKNSKLQATTYVRNSYYIDETDELVIAGFRYYNDGIYIKRKNSDNFEYVLSHVECGAFAYLGNGIMLASQMNYINGESISALKAQRKNNILSIIIDREFPFKEGQLITFSVSPDNQFSAYENVNTQVINYLRPIVQINQIGPDTDLINLPEKSKIYTGTGKNKIYISKDFGHNWNIVYEFNGCNAMGYAEFASVFPILDNENIYLSIGGYDVEENRAGIGEILKSKDLGNHWEKTNEIKGINGQRLNAIYDCTKLKDGRLICGGQFGRIIFTLQ